MYNLTLLQESWTVQELFVTANTYSANILVGLIMIAIFFIILMALKNYDFDEALFSSGLVCFILSILLRVSGDLNIMFVVLFLIITGLAGFYMYGKKKFG